MLLVPQEGSHRVIEQIRRFIADNGLKANDKSNTTCVMGIKESLTSIGAIK